MGDPIPIRRKGVLRISKKQEVSLNTDLNDADFFRVVDSHMVTVWCCNIPIWHRVYGKW